jgi:uncharacterized protein YwqG
MSLSGRMIGYWTSSRTATDSGLTASTNIEPLPTIFIVKDIPRTQDDMQRKSFIGGRPLVPANFIWPTRKPSSYEKISGRVKDIPLHFVCQFDCSNLTQVATDLGLPSRGTLYLFYGLDTEAIVEASEPSFWKVIYIADDGVELVRGTLPKGLKRIEMGCELQTEPSGKCRPYKELGYIPISFKLGKTHLYMSASDGGLAYKSERRFAKLAYLDPQPNTPEIDVSKFDLSARNAKNWLKHDLDIIPRRIEVMTCQLSDFDSGKRAEHPGVGFFQELKLEKKKSGFTGLSEEEIWQEVANKWRTLLPRFKDRLPQLLELSDDLNNLSDDELVPAALKIRFEEHKAFSDEVAVFKNTFDSEEAKKSRQILLARSSLDELGLDEIETAFANYERKQIEHNENHLFGYADEVQTGSMAEAFDYAQAMGWLSPGQSADDMMLLLQLDSCAAGSGMMWGDMGKAYFYILKDDFADGRFDRIAHVMHGH